MGLDKRVRLPPQTSPIFVSRSRFRPTPGLGYGSGRRGREGPERTGMPKSTTHADGWAVTDDRGLNIRTVSETRRGAIINWLVVAARVLVLANQTDDEIEYLWVRHGVNPGRAQVHKVCVNAV